MLFSSRVVRSQTIQLGPTRFFSQISSRMTGAAVKSPSKPLESSNGASTKRSLSTTTSPSKKTKLSTIKISSWNVSSLNACLKKGFQDVLNSLSADILVIQETKLNPSNKEFHNTMKAVEKRGYPYQYWAHSTAKKGYSGSAVFSKFEPLKVTYGVGDLKLISGDAEIDKEGRYITLEFEGTQRLNKTTTL
jgi:hypothetical protein